MTGYEKATREDLHPRLFEDHAYAPGEEPPEVRWFTRRLRRLRSQQLLDLVSLANKEVNNTSVILLFEAGDKKLLFPGDAEVEGWEEALVSDAALLQHVDVYKVGHHGSRNATPLRLWDGFAHRGDEDKAERLQTILSSKHQGKYKDVPRPSLVCALEEETAVTSTIGTNELFVSLELDVG